MEFRYRTSKSGCCGNPAKCAFTTASGRCMAREQYEDTIEPENRPVPNFVIIGEGEVHRANPHQKKPKRDAFEEMFGDDQEAIKQAREIQRKTAEKVRERKRNQTQTRRKGRGRGLRR